MKFYIVFILFSCSATAIFAQSSSFSNSNYGFNRQTQIENATISTSKGKWLIGAGVNIVNDGEFGKGYRNTDFENYFNPKVWSFNFFTVQAEYAINESFYLSSMISKNLNGENDKRIFAADFNLKYSFSRILPANSIFEPYVMAGTGYTWRESVHRNRLNMNFGLGTYFWFNEAWGLNIQLAGKLTLRKDPFNYKQNSLTLVYRFQ